jgi:hypothetical protein
VIAPLNDICRGARVWRALQAAASLSFGVSTISNAQGQKAETGYLTSFDGIRLYYAKVGNGSETVIIPGRLFMFRDFQQLAKGRTLIFYDMRNRGLSDLVADTPAPFSSQERISHRQLLNLSPKDPASRLNARFTPEV